MIKLTVLGKPITKKNSQRILYNRKAKRHFIAPSKQFEIYKRDFLLQARKHRRKHPVDEPICIQALYYMPTRHKVDITNLMSATHDLLQDGHIIADDSSDIVKSVDGSRVLYDKLNPRVEIIITEFKE